MKRLFVALVLISAGCSSKPPAEKPAPVSAPDLSKAKKYPMHGKVIGIDSVNRTAKIDADAMPGFMEAMAMDYPVKSQADMNMLASGETIDATVYVTEDGYWVSEIKPVPVKPDAKK